MQIKKLILLIVYFGVNCFGFAQGNIRKRPADDLPPYIKRVTLFGERADWSHDGQRILFIEKTYGDAYELEVKTNNLKPITHHFYHGGFTRAFYLANGDVLLSGSTSFDADNPHQNRVQKAELWILDKSYLRPPVRLFTKCFEGPAVSRKNMQIAWTIVHEQYPDLLVKNQTQFWMAEVVYKNEIPSLENKKLLFDTIQNLSATKFETQNFIPPFDKELIFQAAGNKQTDVMKLNLETGAVVNLSGQLQEWSEPEGIFPDGKFTALESDHHSKKGVQYIDLYTMKLDGSNHLERLTFLSEQGLKASNPVVSDDAKWMAFQLAKRGDPPGIGRGIFIYDFIKAAKYKNRKSNSVSK